MAEVSGVSPSSISKLKAQFHITGDVRDRAPTEHSKKITPPKDRFSPTEIYLYSTKAQQKLLQSALQCKLKTLQHYFVEIHKFLEKLGKMRVAISSAH